jgi:hypothetical protein
MLGLVEKRAFVFAEEVLTRVVAFAEAASAEITFKKNDDPKLFGLALLCRSISSFEGALMMARHDRAVECRTLIRLCFENLFLVDKLRLDGAAAVKAMQSHEAASRISVGEAILKHGVADSPQGKTIRKLIKSEHGKSPKKLRVSDTAKGEIEKAYPAYALLSHDAAHASITALERHLPLDHSRRLTVDVVPPFKPGERLVTLDIACEALLGVCLGVGAMLGGTSQDDAVGVLWKRFVDQSLTCGGLAKGTEAATRR